VEHVAHHGDGVVELEVPVRVPLHRGDPVEAREAQRREGGGQPLDPVGELGVGVPEDALLRPIGYHLVVEQVPGPLIDPVDSQLGARPFRDLLWKRHSFVHLFLF